MNIDGIFSKIGVSFSLTQNVILILVLVGLAVLYATTIGKRKLLASLMGIYTAFAMVAVAPWSLVGDNYLYKLVVFASVILVLTFFDRRFFDVGFSGFGSAFWAKVILVSLLEVVLLLAGVLQIIPKSEALRYLSVTAYGYLAVGWWPLVWFLAPLVVLWLVVRRYRY